jgi:hypothetical protein
MSPAAGDVWLAYPPFTRANQNRARIAALNQQWRELCPPLFRATDPNHPAINQDLLAKNSRMGSKGGRRERNRSPRAHGWLQNPDDVSAAAQASLSPHRSPLWTSNASGDDLRNLMSENRGPAIIRRLAEFSSEHFVPSPYKRAEPIAARPT